MGPVWGGGGCDALPTGLFSVVFSTSSLDIISIPFHNSDTAIRVPKAIIGAKVITLCFGTFV